MNEYYHKFYTQYLQRDMEMLVFGHSGYPVILFPTSEGRYYENKDFGLIESARYYLESGKIKIYCPDGIDGESWYNYDLYPEQRLQSHLAYEQMIINDVIGFARYETSRDHVGLAGASMGAYHAANIAFKYPDQVGYLFSMSGIFDIKEFLDDYYSEDVYFNNPVDYLPGLDNEWYLDQLKWMEIVLGVGYTDHYYVENEHISNVLRSKNIGHCFDARELGEHDWPTWHHMFSEYLSKINC